jgi:peptidoglycan hydrolase-like protein with peptidoglycan-binding domain
MTLQGRNLQQGLTGADVAQLQTELTRLSYTIPAAEQANTSFGAGTLAAVQHFQAAHGLPSTGIVDTATAAALGAAVDNSTYTITGKVISPARPGLGNLIVSLVDKNVGGDVALATATTDASGAYSITVVIPPTALAGRNKTAPDLQARVMVQQVFVAASNVSYNAPNTVVLDVALPASTAGLPSEYETLTATVSQIFKGRLSTLQETAEQQDVTFVANKSGWDARAVALAVLADQFSQIAVPPPPSPAAPAPPTGLQAAVPVPSPVPSPAPAPIPTPPPPPTPVTLQAEFYYALFRAGLPAAADTLFQASPSAVEAIWQNSIAAGIIPQALANSIPAAVKTFQSLSAGHLLTAVPSIGPSNLQQMLSVAKVSSNNQQTFAELYVQYRNNPAALWPAVSSALGAPAAAQLQLAGRLFYMTVNNAPVISALLNAESANPISSTADLALRGYYDSAKWTPLIGTNVPAGIPGAPGAEQQSNYANLLAAQVRVAHPTVVLAAQVAAGVMKTSDTPAVATGVHDFLIQHQGQFEIGLDPVEAYIARAKVTGTASAVVTQIKRLQRVYQLTPDDTSMAFLLANPLDSAYAITRYDAEGFKRTYAAQLGGEAVADAIHARAAQVFSTVLNVTINYLGARVSPSLGGGFPVHIPFPSPAPAPSYPVIAYPTLESLFGSLDYCDCSDCRSILSPAAYLVNLLNYLDQPSPSAGYQNPQSALLQRRPDLQYLPLTCANTNTALPYIDIVNETLEYYVANSLSLAGYQGHDTSSTVTSAELLACPQFVNDAAYTTLQGAFFPPPLPYNRPLELLRLHLSTIGVALPDVMAALRASDAVERGAAAYGWRDILLEQLDISRDEYRLFTDTTLKLQGLYGYTGLSDAAVLQMLQTMNLQTFSRRTGVSYDDLSSILQTTFINPGAALIPRLLALNTTFSALQALKTTPSTAAAFIASLPAGIDATQYGGANPADYNAIVNWVVDPVNFPKIMGLIVITDPSDGPDQCSGTALQIRYANPDNTANLLDATDLTKLILFIRLWQKLGLTIEQTDDALAALYPAADLPSGTNDAVNLPLLATGFSVFLPRLGFLMRVMNTLGLSANTALAPLLACWATIDSTEPDSLYAQMFLTPTLVQPDAAFAPNSYGVLFSSTTEPLMAHQSTLCAAFNLTGADFVLITSTLGYTSTTVLNLANISAIYRIGWFAHTLGMSVVEFLLLRQLSGLDPFTTLDPSSTPPAEPPAVRFIRLQQALNTAGLAPVQALYLIWNQDISGRLAPPLSAITGLAWTLRADFAAVNAQFTLVDDPDGTIALGLMTLVYGSSASNFFFGLLNNTLVTSVAYGNPTPTLAQPILDASSGRLAYDDLRKQLSFAGALDAATRAAIDAAITSNGNLAALHTALANLAAANQQAVGPFFATYPELLPLYTAYVASSDPLQTRRTTLLASFLPTLTGKRKQEEALSAATAAAGGDPTFAPALLQDPTILHAAADATQPAGNDLTAIETEGLQAQFFLTNNPVAPPDQNIDAVPILAYSPSTNPLPPGTAGSAIAGIWSGYLDVPQDGFYNISVAADAGATVTLAIAGTPVTMAAASNVWSNTTPITLTTGQLASIVLTVTTVKNTVTVTWESLGLGSQVIPSQYLYSMSLVQRLGATYTRFLKAVTLASVLSLDANEIAWLGTAGTYAVSTTDAKDNLAPGTVTFTPVSMANISIGSKLVIDSGAAQESTTVTAATATTFTATTTHVHNGTTTPFAIVSQATPTIGQGWLNYLATSQSPAPADAANLGLVLTALLDFARMKAALSPSDERLLSLLQNPALQLPNGGSALLALTGWAQDSVNTLLTQFFGDSNPSHLAVVENFRRVFDAFTIVTQCRITAAALLAATTNAPAPASVAALQSALRALYAPQDWLTVVKPINDAMRIQQRDALVAYILQEMGDAFAKLQVVQTTTADTPTGTTQVSLGAVAGVVVGMVVQGLNIAPGTTVGAIAANTLTLSLGVVADLPTGSSLTFVPANAQEIDTPDKLYEYFLIDVETQPPVETSRILLALSATQLFIERVLRNLEPEVFPTDIDGSLWVWMKRYRVWQANREVFLWPENWLYPELRDNQSPAFQQAMTALLQSDITDDAAASAYLDYLTSLEAVAKLEVCGLYYVAPTNDADEISYVVARTAGAHRKYYFRMLQYGAWTPWNEVKIECEDMPITPIVWNGRLFLFWLKIIKQSNPQPPAPGFNPTSPSVSNWQLGDLQNYTSMSDSSQSRASVDVSAVLHWAEFYNGKWQPTKTSEISRPTYLGSFAPDGPDSFDVDRNLLQIIPIDIQSDPTSIPPLVMPTDALVLAVTSTVQNIRGPAGFILYNTHSLPVRLDDINLDQPLVDEVVAPPTDRWFAPNSSYTGAAASGTFNIAYVTYDAGNNSTTVYTNNIIGFSRVPRYVTPQLGLVDAWDAPFFYEDRRYVFYVTTSQTYYTLGDFGGFGVLNLSPTLVGTIHELPQLVLSLPPIPKPDPVAFTTTTGQVSNAGSAAPVQGFLAQSSTIRNALGSSAAVTFQGRQIYPSGSVAASARTSTNTVAGADKKISSKE